MSVPGSWVRSRGLPEPGREVTTTTVEGSGAQGPGAQKKRAGSWTRPPCLLRGRSSLRTPRHPLLFRRSGVGLTRALEGQHDVDLRRDHEAAAFEQVVPLQVEVEAVDGTGRAEGGTL